MEQVLKMVGHTTAHAICAVASGSTLIPILGFLREDGSTDKRTLVMGSKEARAEGEKVLKNISSSEKGITFIKDGYVTLNSVKTDALHIDIHFGEKPEQKILIIIPYRSAQHEEGFAIYKPKIVEFNGFDE
jgi:hypothetical protein